MNVSGTRMEELRKCPRFIVAACGSELGRPVWCLVGRAYRDFRGFDFPILGQNLQIYDS